MQPIIVNRTYYMSATDLIVNCVGAVDVYLPPLSSVNDIDERTIYNVSGGTVTINSRGQDKIYDVLSFPIYPGENLSVQKINNKWNVK